jgi:hypothetical protein
LLGRYQSGTWSPNGRFVAVTRDNVLYAVEPGTGTVRWPLVRNAPLADVRWAPKDGFRIAYREGTDLRVVDGLHLGVEHVHDGLESSLLPHRDLRLVSRVPEPEPLPLPKAAKTATYKVKISVGI